MNKKPCIQCGEHSLVISNEVHFCAPCWIDKFLVNTGGKIDGQSNRKVFGSDRKTLQSGASEPSSVNSAY